MNQQRNIVAIVLARAGSRGVPGKNTMLVGGRPCIAWTIEAAQNAATVGTVLVSTDDATATRVGTSMGARCIARPQELASDTARVDDAVRDCVLRYEQGGSRIDAAVVLYANVPVRPWGLIDRAVHVFKSSGCDSVQSYTPVGKNHPWWTARLGESGSVAAWEPGAELNHGVFRRQDLPDAFVPDGGVLVVSRAALFGEVPNVNPGPHAFFGADRRGVINPIGSVVDIDSPIDAIVADTILMRSLLAQAA